jgi:putative NADH-flavin reductase
VIFGATGDTGKLLVDQALVAGYEVIVYVRSPSKLNVNDKNLTVIQESCLTLPQLKQP